MTDLIEKMILAYYPGEEDLSAEFINGNVEDMKAVARVMLEAMREYRRLQLDDAVVVTEPITGIFTFLNAYAKENGL